MVDNGNGDDVSTWLWMVMVNDGNGDDVSTWLWMVMVNNGNGEDGGLGKTMKMKTPNWARMTTTKKLLIMNHGTRYSGLTLVSYF